jgi:hypothetical protein
MGKQQDKKAPATPDKFFVLGFDDKGKPRGARFAEYNERVLNFVSDLMLTSVYPASAAFAEAAMKLPPGRVYSSGKAFVPPVKRDLIEKLVHILNVPGDESKTFKLASSPGQTPEQEGNPEEAKIRTISPVTFGLPRTWDSIQAGHVVLVLESPADGWWEATVLEREDEILTLRYRDFPRQPKFQRHIAQIALINPGPMAQ